MESNSAIKQFHGQISSLIEQSIVTIQDLMRELCLDSLQARKIMMSFAVSNKKKQNYKYIYLVERQLENFSIQFSLVQEAELLRIIRTGEKLLNAYIYAIVDDNIHNKDQEFYDANRMAKNFDVFSPCISFDHCEEVQHQNGQNRRVSAPVKVAEKAKLQVHQPIIKQEIKKNEVVKPQTQKQAQQQQQQQQQNDNQKKQTTLFSKPEAKPQQVSVKTEVKQEPPVAVKKEKETIQEKPDIKMEEVKLKEEAKVKEQEQLSGEKPSSKTKKTNKDTSQDSIVQKLQSNKIFDSDEEKEIKKEEQKQSNRKKLKKNDTVAKKEEEVEEEPEFQRNRTNNKKRAMMDDSDEEMNNELDVESKGNTKENRNIANMFKKINQSSTQVAPSEKQIEKEIAMSGAPKGKRKVKKSRTYFDEKGYMVNEDYSSYEEYEIPERKDPVKKTQINLTQAAGSKAHAMAAGEAKPTGKTQSSLSSFFGGKK